jgi:hypothetical protein
MKEVTTARGVMNDIRLSERSDDTQNTFLRQRGIFPGVNWNETKGQDLQLFYAFGESSGLHKDLLTFPLQPILSLIFKAP